MAHGNRRYPVSNGKKKLCGKCKKTRLTKHFNMCLQNPDGYQSWCRWCNAEAREKAKIKRKASGLPSYAVVDNRKLRLEVLSAYSNGPPRCACCGEEHLEFLSLDHINGGGGAHRRELGCGQRVYRHLRRDGFPPGYRVLCHNCNQAIGAYGYCPHNRL